MSSSTGSWGASPASHASGGSDAPLADAGGSTSSSSLPPHGVEELRAALLSERLRSAHLSSELSRSRHQAVDMATSAEAEGECISNRLLKRLDELKAEQASLRMEVDREEEFISNTLQRRLAGVLRDKAALNARLEREETRFTAVVAETIREGRREKVALENELEQEQEFLVNRLQRQLGCALAAAAAAEVRAGAVWDAACSAAVAAVEGEGGGHSAAAASAAASLSSSSASSSSPATALSPLQLRVQAALQALRSDPVLFPPPPQVPQASALGPGSPNTAPSLPSPGSRPSSGYQGQAAAAPQPHHRGAGVGAGPSLPQQQQQQQQGALEGIRGGAAAPDARSRADSRLSSASLPQRRSAPAAPSPSSSSQAALAGVSSPGGAVGAPAPPAPSSSSPAAAAELARLRDENFSLRQRLAAEKGRVEALVVEAAAREGQAEAENERVFNVMSGGERGSGGRSRLDSGASDASGASSGAAVALAARARLAGLSGSALAEEVGGPSPARPSPGQRASGSFGALPRNSSFSASSLQMLHAAADAAANLSGSPRGVVAPLPPPQPLP